MFGRQREDGELAEKSDKQARLQMGGCSVEGASDRRIRELSNEVAELRSWVVALYEHLGLERVRVTTEVCQDMRLLISETRDELRKIAPVKAK